MNEIARELLKVAKLLTASGLKLKKVSGGLSSGKMWAAVDSEDLVYGIVKKGKDTLTEKLPYTVIAYETPERIPVSPSNRDTLLGHIYVWDGRGGRKALKMALRYIEQGRKFGEETI